MKIDQISLKEQPSTAYLGYDKDKEQPSTACLGYGKDKKEIGMHRVMSLAENYCFVKSASIAFDWSNANGLSPNPYYKQKERANRS